jgi:hypothetical protein
MLGLRHDTKLGRRSRGSKSRSADRVKEIEMSKHTIKMAREVLEEAEGMMSFYMSTELWLWYTGCKLGSIGGLLCHVGSSDYPIWKGTRSAYRCLQDLEV